PVRHRARRRELARVLGDDAGEAPRSRRRGSLLDSGLPAAVVSPRAFALSLFRRTLFAAALCAATGCARQPQRTNYELGPGSGAPRRGGHAVFVREEDPDYLDPALSYGTYSAAVTEA